MLVPSQISNRSPKVKKRWTQILGGGQSSNDTVARVSLRKKLGKEPSIEDLKKFADKLTPGIYAALAKDLEDDVDRAFCKGEEVCLARFSRPESNIRTTALGYYSLGDEMCGI